MKKSNNFFYLIVICFLIILYRNKILWKNWSLQKNKRKNNSNTESWKENVGTENNWTPQILVRLRTYVDNPILVNYIFKS